MTPGPLESTHSQEGADGPTALVRLLWERTPGGLACVGVDVRQPDGLSAKALKDLPLGRWLEEGRWAVGQQLMESENDRVWASWNNGAAEHRRRRQYGDDHFQLVASVYGALEKSSSKAMTRLAEQFDVDVTTARRWVVEARKRGLLPSK